MADSLTPNLQLTIQTPGGNNNSWGAIENTNKEEIDDKFGDVTSVSTTGGTTTLSVSQEVVNALTISGTLVSNATIVFSGRGGSWVVKNATTGAFTVTCKVSGQTGVTVSQSDTRLVYCNGADIAYATGSTDLVNDTSPQLGADLDANGFSIQFDDATGIEDDAGNELVQFLKNALAVNHLQIRNAPTGNAVQLNAVGDDTNIALNLSGKGTGGVNIVFHGSGLQWKDTDGSHQLQLIFNSNLGANRSLTLITGDADRSITLAGNLNVSGAAEISGTHTGTHSGTSSGTNTGDQTVPSAASQAQQEAASATNVHTSPGTQHFHPGHPKAWVNFNGSGTIAINRDYGVSSLTDNGTGNYTVNFDTAFSDTTYGAIPSARSDDDSPGNDVLVAPWASDAKTSSAMQFHVWDEANNAAFDSSEVSVFFASDYA